MEAYGNSLRLEKEENKALNFNENYVYLKKMYKVLSLMFFFTRLSKDDQSGSVVCPHEKNVGSGFEPRERAGSDQINIIKN